MYVVIDRIEKISCPEYVDVNNSLTNRKNCLFEQYARTPVRR